MQVVRQMGNGILYGLVSVMLVVGGLSLALAESYTAPSPTPTTSLPTVIQTLTSTPSGPTALPISTSTSTATPPPPTNCPPPAGWVLISVQPYDTLEFIAARFGVTPSQLTQANCLLTNNLEPGYNLYVPVPPTNQPISCGAPFGGGAPTLSSREIRYIISPRCIAQRYLNFNRSIVFPHPTYHRARDCGCLMFPLPRQEQSSLISADRLQDSDPKHQPRSKIRTSGFSCNEYFDGDIKAKSTTFNSRALIASNMQS